MVTTYDLTIFTTNGEIHYYNISRVAVNRYVDYYFDKEAAYGFRQVEHSSHKVR